MTTVPYPIQVTVSGGTDTTQVVVTVMNVTNNTYTFARTNNNGEALLDLANAGEWSTTNTVRVMVKDSGQYAYESFVIGDSTSHTSTLTLQAISRSSMLTDLWDVMYEHLQTGQYAITTDNIHSAKNDTIIADEGYPQVTIYVPKFELADLTVGGVLSTYLVNYFIEVYHTSSASCKSLADEVIYAIQNGRGVFNTYGLKRPTISVDYDYYDDGKKKIHVMAISINFTMVKS